jgi:hypothetical protein
MTHVPHTKTLGSAALVIAVEIVTLLLLFALQQAFTR